MIQISGAAGMIVLNKGMRGILEMPSGGLPLAQTITIPSIMIPYESITILKNLTSSSGGKPVLAQMAAHDFCEDKKSLQDLEEKLQEMTGEDLNKKKEEARKMLLGGGQMEVRVPKSDKKLFFDYLESKFGKNTYTHLLIFCILNKLKC